MNMEEIRYRTFIDDVRVQVQRHDQRGKESIIPRRRISAGLIAHW